MELKPRSDGRRTKASLPEKKKSSQDDRAAQSAAKRMSLLLSLYRLQGLPKTRTKQAQASGILTTRTLKITQTSESEKERLIFRISHGKRLVSGFKFPVMLTTKTLQRDQANKGTGWMPRRHLPKKDATNCEKPRGAVSGL